MQEAEKHSDTHEPIMAEREAPRTKYSILTLQNYRKRMVDEQQLIDLNYPDDDRMRAFYVMRTDRLIQEAEIADVDTIFYLDKSARPIQWMVKEFWPIFAGDKPMPESKFANIDASEWLGKTSDEPRPDETEIFLAKIPQEAIEELRETFRDPNNRDASVFDGKKVMVVDEVSVSGGSLGLAVKILSEAFPKAEFIGRAWMIPEKVKKGHGMYPKELPVWYHKTDPRGRGVGDTKPGSRVLSAPGAVVNPDLIEQSGLTETEQEALRSRAKEQEERGIIVPPSSRVYVQDKLSNQLRTEIAQLAKDVKEGRQSIVPGNREDSEYFDVDPSTGQIVTDDKGRPVSTKFKIRYVN